jgi:hypothetical protein
MKFISTTARQRNSRTSTQLSIVLTKEELENQINPLYRLMIKELSLLSKRSYQRLGGSTITSLKFQDIVDYSKDDTFNEDDLNLLRNTYLPIEKVYKYFKDRQEDTRLLNIIYKETSKSIVYEFGTSFMEHIDKNWIVVSKIEKEVA